MNASDRCDRCGAQAYVRVMFTTGDLMFCGHHYEANKDAFPLDPSDGAEMFAVVEDDRERLLVSA